jgi:hypothetical protein
LGKWTAKEQKNMLANVNFQCIDERNFTEDGFLESAARVILFQHLPKDW